MQQTEGRAEKLAQTGRKNHTEFWWVNLLYKPVPETARSKARVRRPLVWWDCEFAYGRGHECFSFLNAVFSGTGLCIGLITRPEEFYSFPVSVIAKPRHGKPWLGMRSNLHGEGGMGGWRALVQKPRVIKQEETGTDSWDLRNLIAGIALVHGSIQKLTL